MAPEMLAEGGYTQKADMWSVGVMTCMILCGEPPFLKNEDDLLDEKKVERLRMAKYTFATPLWKKVSPEAKGLIGSLLKKAPGYRLSAKEALHYCEHIWMKAVTSSEGAPPSGSPGKHNSKDPMLLSRIATSMRSFAEYSTVKKVALMIAAFQLDTEEISVLRDAFLEIDADRSGLITVEELAEALKSQNMNEAEVRRVFAGIDQDKSNKLHWTEFLAATLEMVGEVEEERLLDAFERMDVDNTGSISNSDLQRLMGSSHTPEMISDMLRETQAGEGIDFFQFRELLKCTTPVASLPAVATPDQSSLPQESVEASPNAS
jgi:calcium-dependent protein kinase